MIFSVAYRYRKSISIIESVIYIYISIYIYIERYVEFMASQFSDISRCLSKWFIEIYRVGDNIRTVNTSSTPHIRDQLGTENACKTLLCQFIVMILFLVCNNMYRYRHHFGLFYRNPTILETVKMLPANRSTRENFCFYWNTATGNNCITDVSLLWQNVKIKRKEYFSYHFRVGLSECSNHVVLKFPDCAITYDVSTQSGVGAAKHYRQNAYLTTMFSHRIGGHFKN